MYTSHIHWVARGTGTPKDKDEVNRQLRLLRLILHDVYYELRKRDLTKRLINEGRCDERLKAKVEESTFLTYTGRGCTTTQTRNT